MAELLTEERLTDDRRRVVNAGQWHGRDVVITNLQAVAQAGANITVTVMATRGERLALTRLTSRDPRREEFDVEMLTIVETDADNKMAAYIAFDPDDLDAAFKELDTRYLGGEAAAYSHTWSVVAGAYNAVNRHELPATTPDWAMVDHRPLATFDADDLAAFLNATWELAAQTSMHIVAVHRLSTRGAVVTHASHATSQDCLDAEWQDINVVTVEVDLIDRCEIFGELDIDAALARFEELDRPAPLLENAATRTWARSIDTFNRRDIDGYIALTATEGQLEDRRKGLRGLFEGPARQIAIRELVAQPESWRLTTEPIAIRGSRLSLTRECCRDIDAPGQPITVEVLTVTEVDDDGLIRDTVSFDPDDLDAAFAELTARWIASGEVAHPQVIETHHRFTEIFNRHDWDALAEMSAGTIFVDHRQLAAEGTDTIADHMPSMRTMASLVPDLWVEQAQILTHSAFGVVTHTVAKGASADGVAIELPLVVLLIDGDRIARIEDFDPAQRDLALARFEEIGRS